MEVTSIMKANHTVSRITTTNVEHYAIAVASRLKADV